MSTTSLRDQFAIFFATWQMEQAKRREITDAIIRNAEMRDSARNAILQNAEKKSQRRNAQQNVRRGSARREKRMIGTQ